jgi:two-component system, sensor histidine kinase and response regulator
MTRREPFTATEQAQLLREVSHELRTPLGAAMIWLRIYHETPDSEQKSRAISMIEDSLGELLQMAQDLSDCSALIESRLELESSPTTLNQLVGDLTRGLQPKAAQRNIALELDPGTAELPVQIDRMRLGRALGSILGYAIAVHAPETRMTIALERDGGDAVLRVPMSEGTAGALVPLRDHLRDGTGQFGASGLTLPIAVELIQLHGGAIHRATPDRPSVEVRLPSHTP